MSHKKTKKKNLGGRPNKYFTNVKPRLEAIKMYRRDGQTEENIAKLLDVGYSTFMAYKVKYPELVEALEESKEDLIAKLEKTMYQVALGYITTTDRRTVRTISSTGETTIREEELVKEFAPNTTALMFSLKHLKPEKWTEAALEDNKEDQEEKEIIESIGILIDDIKQRKETSEDEEVDN